MGHRVGAMRCAVHNSGLTAQPGRTVLCQSMPREVFVSSWDCVCPLERHCPVSFVAQFCLIAQSVVARFTRKTR